MQLGRRPAAALSAALVALVIGAAPAAQAGLLGPLLQLLRPQLESRLSSACMQWASGGDAALAERLQQPCRALAGPASRCLIEESERSGRTLAVIQELLGRGFGDDSELVVKRCASRLLGLPADSFADVPLRRLAERLRGQTAAVGNDQGDGSASGRRP
jgi:hypothetical protein